MTKKNKKKLSVKNNSPKDSLKASTLFNRFDRVFANKQNLFLFLSIVLTAVFGMYLFDFKVSTGGDDSTYIVMGKKFLDGKAFPTWHGEFYAIFLSLPILIFGLKLFVLKLFSLFFLIGHLVVFYLLFKNKVSPLIISLVMLLTAINAELLYFGSQTYTEAMYMFLQILMFYFFYKLYTNIKINKLNYVGLWKQWLTVGLLIFLCTVTKNIGVTALFAIIAFLILDKKFYSILYVIGSFLIFKLPYELWKKIAWDTTNGGTSHQFKSLLAKDAYNPSLGNEDFSGMIERFLANFKIYLSKFFFSTIGLKDPSTSIGDLTYLPGILVTVLFLVALFFAFKKSKLMLLVSLYVGISVFATLFAVQQSWGQLRLVLIYLPMLYLLIAWGIKNLGDVINNKPLKNLIYLFVGVMLVFLVIKGFGSTANRAKHNHKILSKNIKGNKYYGFTPDWTNYLQLSEWIGKNMPDSVGIGARKPSMAFIYSGGKQFHGIYQVPMINADSILSRIRPDSSSMVMIGLNEIDKLGLPRVEYSMVRVSFEALTWKNDKAYGLINLKNPALRDLVIETAKTKGIIYYSSYGSIADALIKDNSTKTGVFPKDLIDFLKDKNIDYVIQANLRINPNMKTDRTINTIARFKHYVELKYPGIFQKMVQNGEDENEPASLYQVNYGLYKL